MIGLDSDSHALLRDIECIFKLITVYNRNTNRQPFSEAVIEAVWQKGKVVTGYDANKYRKDACGIWMVRSAYGNTSSEYGWEVDHNKPVSKGGTDNLSNLLPLNWQNNRHKSDNYPTWYCKFKAA